MLNIQKATPSSENSVDPDKLASDEIGWLHDQLTCKDGGSQNVPCYLI